MGKFWQMHRILYDNQERLDDRALRNYGRRIGLSEQAMEDAFNDRFADRIEADFKSGIDSGVNATPTLFINGRRIGGLAWPDLQLVIKLELDYKAGK